MRLTLLLSLVLLPACGAPSATSESPMDGVVETSHGSYAYEVRDRLAERIVPWGIVDQYAESIEQQPGSTLLRATRLDNRGSTLIGSVAWRENGDNRLMVVCATTDRRRHVVIEGICNTFAWQSELAELERRAPALLGVRSRLRHNGLR